MKPYIIFVSSKIESIIKLNNPDVFPEKHEYVASI